jgi:DNA excision repair protein ERCC-1
MQICLINNVTVLVAFSWVLPYCFDALYNNDATLRFEEAGHYLTTLKQFEHKPPDMIKERVDKDYHSILRTALTSIGKVNKTDVETLRTSFGVSRSTFRQINSLEQGTKNFANISKASPDQLRNLPGFGQVKVKNIKNAFEKPIRNKATRTLPITASQDQRASASRDQDTVAQSTSEKAKEPSFGLGRPARDPSPVWDIELDMDDGPANSRRPQPFDIELDLN